MESIYVATDRIFIFLNDRPWYGPLSDNSKTKELIRSFPDPAGKIQVVRGDWENEVSQRNYALDMLAQAGFGYQFIIDADEVYDPGMLTGMMQYAKARPEVDCWHCWFVVYWKTLGYRIDPPENHHPPIFLKVGSGRFVEYRNCKAGTHKLIPAEIGFCHHLSYARSDEQIQRKLRSFSHADQIPSDWYERVWKAWDFDHGITDLCPYNPGVFQRAVPVDPIALPQVLRTRIAEK
ncbi:MAG: hypothetical protein GX589_09435 [Deltaproteobacteria bacterium]|nr:hypothetical protein [Deltaproteobacteria bacterium]